MRIGKSININHVSKTEQNKVKLPEREERITDVASKGFRNGIISGVLKVAVFDNLKSSSRPSATAAKTNQAVALTVKSHRGPACRHNGTSEIDNWDIIEHFGDGDFGKGTRDVWEKYGHDIFREMGEGLNKDINPKPLDPLGTYQHGRP